MPLFPPHFVALPLLLLLVALLSVVGKYSFVLPSFVEIVVALSSPFASCSSVVMHSFLKHLPHDTLHLT